MLFQSFNGLSYSDNPRAISEAMHALYPDYELVWALKDNEKSRRNAPDYVRFVAPYSVAFYRELASSFCFVNNEAMRFDLPKRKGQFFIQTWHGDRGIKKILYDAWEDGQRPHPIMDEKMTDLFVVGSDYAQRRIQTAFRYHGEVLNAGCPRNDCLIFPAKADQVRRAIGVEDGKKLLLYAPTFRRNSKILPTPVNVAETLAHLNGRGGDWVCLMRAHPKAMGVDLQAAGNVIDVSGYPDMSDLLMIADALITDYSSCAGDFILRGKPVFLAQFDLDRYTKENRTFHVDITQSGYLITHTQEELNRLIDTLTDQQIADNCEQIMRFFGAHETGRSAQQVCRMIDQRYQALRPGK
ncbi:MAG: CDP-glycerol glycerophosphotransferase family protein [Clostridia bacterium]|nr:CDP-glycerol glycerophosphotransferase family protein [Clostridia bacterium]